MCSFIGKQLFVLQDEKVYDVFPGLSLRARAGTRDFPGHYLSINLGYFLRKKKNQNNFLAFKFPTCLLYVPGNVKT